MIRIENTLRVRRERQEVWGFLNDISALAKCVPQCKKFNIADNDRFDVDLVLRLGRIPLENVAHMEVRERQEPHRLVMSGTTTPGKGLASVARLADGDSGDTRLTIAFGLEEDGGSTLIHYVIEADASGNLKRVYEGIIRGQRATLETSFVKNVGNVLGAEIEILEPLVAEA